MTTQPDPNQPVAIVTGAGTGIGRATAAALARDGFALVLVGRRREPLRQTAEAIGNAATVHQADIGDQTQARALIDRLADTFRRLDVLVNNAGVAPLKPIDQTTDADIEQTFRINALGPASLIAHAWPLLRRTEHGCIVNVSTLGTRDPFPGFFAYAASKCALNSMTRSCAIEGADIGLRAFTIAPGAVETPMLRGLFSPDQIPADACLQPEAIAEVIAACVRGEHDEMNGRVIWLTGPGKGG
ncbi:MAG: SDR family NAD(P)-dependent oxidoreductase [Phycisphaerales bacterium]